MKVEHLDDLALLAHHVNHIGLSDLIDKHLPDHGNWQGVSGGSVVAGWVLYILSEADHRLSHVEDWAASRLSVLSALLSQEELRALDFCDDRLGRLLDRFSQDADWQHFECEFGKRLLEVYPLAEPDKMQVVRSDSFNAPQFRTPAELFRYGHTKHRRSDQVQCKVMSACLDPLAIPMAVDIVSGNGPDFEYYLPVIERTRRALGTSGNLYVGDSHMGSSSNRLNIHMAGDYYLMPLNAKQCTRQVLDTYIEQIKVPLEDLPSVERSSQQQEKSAYFYEVPHEMNVEENTWNERRILCYSPKYATKQLVSFEERLDKAEESIRLLVVSKKGRRNPKTLADLYGRIAKIVEKLQVENCFKVTANETVTNYSVGKHKDRPAEIRQQVSLHLEVERDEKIIATKRRKKGWQIYATNATVELISGADLVMTYRNQFRIEHVFDYVINRDTGLLPLYLKKEHRIKGLIRLLMLAMRFSCLVQNTVRQNLDRQQRELGNIYPGNKGRKTAAPTTPMLLRAMRGISVVFLEVGDRYVAHMTDINGTQLDILALSEVAEAYRTLLDLLNTQKIMRET